jgi:hypothetical protein
MRACVLLVGGLLVAAPARADCPSVPKETYEALKMDRSALPKEIYEALVKRYLDPEGSGKGASASIGSRFMKCGVIHSIIDSPVFQERVN